MPQQTQLSYDDIRRQSDKIEAAQVAESWLKAEPLYIDVECSGIDGNAEVIELSVLESDGEILLNTLIKPFRPIPPVASAIHGITDSLVESAPPFQRVFSNFLSYAVGREVIGYNVLFDKHMLAQSAKNYDADTELLDTIHWHDAAKLYSQFIGQLDTAKQERQWFGLNEALRLSGIDVPGSNRLLADAKAIRLLLRHMASAA